MRLSTAALLLALAPLPLLAQTTAATTAPTTAPTAAPAASPTEANPVLARVDGQELRLNDVMAAAAEALPPEMREVPPATLRAMLPPPVFAQLVDRAVTDRVMLNAARAAGMERDEDLRRRVRAFEEGELRDALLRREVLPRLTDEALRVRWQRDVGARPVEEEVRARHILVTNEADARAVLAEVQRGGSFEEIARRRSSDPAARNGGDLGFFRRGDMVAEFATAAFALQPGQVTPQPVRSQFGWHIIKVEERRTGTGPSFDESKEALRQSAIEEEVATVIQRVRAAARVELVEAPAAPVPAGIQAEPPTPRATPAAPPASSTGAPPAPNPGAPPAPNTGAPPAPNPGAPPAQRR